SGPLLFTSRCASGRDPLPSYPGDELHVRRSRPGRVVCDFGCLPAEHRPAEERATCGCDIRMPTGGGGHACVDVRRVNGVPLMTELPPNAGNRAASREVQLRRCLRDAAKLDHRMPSEVARLTAEEREVTPSFM